MSTNDKKCAMKGCLCTPADGKKYCSAYCETAHSETTLQCDCGHPACSGQKL